MLVLGFGAWATVASPAQAANAPHQLLNKEHMLLVQGKPRFILGLYENPKDDAVLKEAVAAPRGSASEPRKAAAPVSETRHA